MPANFDERARRHEVAQPAPERASLLDGQPEQAQQFFRGRGMIDALTDQTKEFSISQHSN
jgi:hypothetical protein